MAIQSKVSLPVIKRLPKYYRYLTTLSADGKEKISLRTGEDYNASAICAHLGGWTVWQKAAKELAGQADVWVDTSSALYALKPDEAARIIHGYGVERTLFGVDFPMWSPAEELERFMALPLTDAEREKILWTNHIGLLGGEI